MKSAVLHDGGRIRRFSSGRKFSRETLWRACLMQVAEHGQMSPRRVRRPPTAVAAIACRRRSALGQGTSLLPGEATRAVIDSTCEIHDRPVRGELETAWCVSMPYTIPPGPMHK